MEHTKGEWVVDGHFADATIVRVDKSTTICHVYDQDSKGDSEANAKLIAAAPELLEALMCICKKDVYDGKIKFNIHEQAKLKELINKATKL